MEYGVFDADAIGAVHREYCVEGRNFNVLFNAHYLHFNSFACLNGYGDLCKISVYYRIFGAVIGSGAAALCNPYENRSLNGLFGVVGNSYVGLFVCKACGNLYVARSEEFAEAYARALPLFRDSGEYLDKLFVFSIKHHSGESHEVCAVSARFGCTLIVLAVGCVFAEVGVVVKTGRSKHVLCKFLSNLGVACPCGDKRCPAAVKEVIEVRTVTQSC